MKNILLVEGNLREVNQEFTDNGIKTHTESLKESGMEGSERLKVDDLTILLASSIKPGPNQNGAIERILDILQNGKLDNILLSPATSEHVDWISDLVR